MDENGFKWVRSQNNGLLTVTDIMAQIILEKEGKKKGKMKIMFHLKKTCYVGLDKNQ